MSSKLEGLMMGIAPDRGMVADWDRAAVSLSEGPSPAWQSLIGGIGLSRSSMSLQDVIQMGAKGAGGTWSDVGWAAGSAGASNAPIAHLGLDRFLNSAISVANEEDVFTITLEATALIPTNGVQAMPRGTR